MATEEPAWMQRVHIPQGYPRPATDAAPDAAFLALYFTGAVIFMTIFQLNRQRGHKFYFTSLSFGFCMARTVATSLRLAWMYNITNRGLAIATTIFTTLGVLILLIINLMFAQRVLRGLHPHHGWHKIVWWTYLFLFLLIPCCLIMVVTAITQLFFTTSPRIAEIDLELEQAATVYFLFFSFLPIPIVLYGLYTSRHQEPDQFGKGSLHLKAIVVLLSATILCPGAAFRTADIFLTFNPAMDGNKWWNDKWSFYFFTFTLEIIVVCMYIALRVDLMFHVPDGSKGPYTYGNSKTMNKLAEDKLSESMEGDL